MSIGNTVAVSSLILVRRSTELEKVRALYSIPGVSNDWQWVINNLVADPTFQVPAESAPFRKQHTVANFLGGALLNGSLWETDHKDYSRFNQDIRTTAAWFRKHKWPLEALICEAFLKRDISKIRSLKESVEVDWAA